MVSLKICLNGPSIVLVIFFLIIIVTVIARFHFFLLEIIVNQLERHQMTTHHLFDQSIKQRIKQLIKLKSN
jgi:hypothetical protein